jgi:serine/threonine protein phosphatase PrpC
VPDLTNFHEVKAQGFEAIGLSIDPSGIISGVPTDTGDHPVAISAFADRDRGVNRVAVEITAEITINPDPKSLWKNLDPPPDAPYPKLHEVPLRVADGPFLILGASKRGRSHAHEAKFRDDAIGALFLPEGEWHVAVVADGAGSAEYSRLGSEVAVETSLHKLEESLPRVDEGEFLSAVAKLQVDREDVDGRATVGKIVYETLIRSAHGAAKALNAKADEDDISVKKLSTTLILGVARRVPGGVFFGSFSIGDGAAGLFRLDPPYLKAMTVSDSGEFAGQTRFLALTEFQPEVSNRIRIDIQPEFSAFILMTDGVTDAKLPTNNALADRDMWKELWTDLSGAVDFCRDNPEAEAQLLNWLDFWSPGNHDDRTIAVICP